MPRVNRRSKRRGGWTEGQIQQLAGGHYFDFLDGGEDCSFGNPYPSEHEPEDFDAEAAAACWADCQERIEAEAAPDEPWYPQWLRKRAEGNGEPHDSGREFDQ